MTGIKKNIQFEYNLDIKHPNDRSIPLLMINGNHDKSSFLGL